MRSIIRDVQEWIAVNQYPVTRVIEGDRLRAYLYALLITAGGFDEVAYRDDATDFDDGHEDLRGEG